MKILNSHAAAGSACGLAACGDIDATFIWDPVLARKKDGAVVILQPDHGATGKATFDGYVANKDWAKANRDFMVKFVKVMADAGCEISRWGKNWKADGAEVKAIAKWSGSKRKDVPAAIALYKFPSAKGRRRGWAAARRRSPPKRWQPRLNSALAKADRSLPGLFGSRQRQLRGRGGEIVVDREA